MFSRHVSFKKGVRFALLCAWNPKQPFIVYKWLFQLDDSQSFHRKWLFHQTSIFKWLFGVPGGCVENAEKMPMFSISPSDLSGSNKTFTHR